jgi:hypothetical protein
MKKLLILCFFVGNNLFSFQAGVELSEIINPDAIYVNKDHVVISEGINLYLYSKANFNLIKKFGKKGEGPGEFKGRVDWVGFLPDSLSISSHDKLSYFSLKGDFLKEIRSKSSRVSGFIPIGNKFVGKSVAFQEKTLYLTINLYNDKLEQVIPLFRKKAGYQRGDEIKIFYSSFDFQVYANKIYIVGKDDFIIDVFDINGKKQPQINLDYSKIKVHDRHIEQVYDYFSKHPETKAQFNQIKKKLRFPFHFPAIRSIFLDSNHIYLQTYKIVDNKTEFYILDINGRLKIKVLLPIKDANIMESYPFTIYNSHVFQLIEDEETETWSLKITKI